MIELETPVRIPEYGTVTCSRCKGRGHNKRTCPERFATVLPAPTSATNLLALSLLAQAGELRAGLVLLAAAAATREERVGFEQAARAVDYAIRQLRG